MKKDYIYLPGIKLDMHCHGRGMNQEYKTTPRQTLLEANESLINITAFMPNTDPPIISIPTLNRYANEIEMAEDELDLKFNQYIFFGMTDDNLDECEKALQHPRVVGLKDYPLGKGGKTVTTGTIGVVHRKTRIAGMKLCRKYNKVYARHCDNLETIKREGYTINAHLADVQETIELAERVPGVKVVICHVPCMQAVELILSAQRKGLKIAIEICPHYPMFSGDGYNWNPRLHPVFYWCYNNLRGRMHLNYLRLLLSTTYDNRLIFLESDNAPHTRAEKLESAKRGKPIGGLPSNRHLVPTVITLAKIHNWTHKQIARLMSWNAADFYGIRVPKELVRHAIEFRKDTGSYNNGIIENPWSHLKMWYPEERRLNA